MPTAALPVRAAAAGRMSGEALEFTPRTYGQHRWLTRQNFQGEAAAYVNSLGWKPSGHDKLFVTNYTTPRCCAPNNTCHVKGQNSFALRCFLKFRLGETSKHDEATLTFIGPVAPVSQGTRAATAPARTPEIALLPPRVAPAPPNAEETAAAPPNPAEAAALLLIVAPSMRVACTCFWVSSLVGKAVKVVYWGKVNGPVLLSKLHLQRQHFSISALGSHLFGMMSAEPPRIKKLGVEIQSVFSAQFWAFFRALGVVVLLALVCWFVDGGGCWWLHKWGGRFGAGWD